MLVINGLICDRARGEIEGLVAAVGQEKAVEGAARQIAEYVLSDPVKIAVAVDGSLHPQLFFARGRGYIGGIGENAIQPAAGEGNKNKLGHHVVVKRAGAAAPAVVRQGAIVAFQGVAP